MSKLKLSMIKREKENVIGQEREYSKTKMSIKKDKITCTKIMPRRTQNMVQQFTLAIPKK